jgi:hypothetical protein
VRIPCRYLPAVSLICCVLLGGCSTSPVEGGGSGKSYLWARDLADPLAELWDPDNAVAAVVGLWLDGHGELGEEADEPLWGLAYTAAGQPEPLAVVVDYDGLAAPLPLEDYELEFDQPLGDYDDTDVLTWMITAADAMRDHPQPLDAYDYLLGAAHEDSFYGRDIAAVGFFEETDQETELDPEGFDPLTLMRGAYAFVLLDCASSTVLLRSWDVIPDAAPPTR